MISVKTFAASLECRAASPARLPLIRIVVVRLRVCALVGELVFCVVVVAVLVQPDVRANVHTTATTAVFHKLFISLFLLDELIRTHTGEDGQAHPRFKNFSSGEMTSMACDEKILHQMLVYPGIKRRRRSVLL
jgi:hypothetical protein